MLAVRSYVWCFCILLLTVGQAGAVGTEWKKQDYASSRIFWAGQEQGIDHIGLHITMEGKWKTYWRNPGDAGVPPRFSILEASENIKGLSLNYPTPKRYVDPSGLESIGYEKQVVYPMELVRKDASAPATLALKLDYMVCERTCIPYTEEMTLEIAADAKPEAVSQELYQDYARNIAAKQGEWVKIGEPEHFTDGESVWLQVDARSTMPLTAVDLFVEGPDGFAFPKPTITYHDDGHSATVRVDYVAFFEKETLIGKDVVLTFTNAHKSAEYEAKVVGAALPAAQAELEAGDAVLGLGMLLLFAYIGGLILNVMPCVLPVLSLKILSVLKHAGKGKTQQVRVAFAMSALGVISSFMLLALLVIALKSAGVSVGWGLHFQQPIFLAIMAVIMALFASNLLDHFHVNLPGLLANRINTSLDGAEKNHQMVGHFLTGAFATLLATPCTAPFLGTAVGLALTGSSSTILMTFFAMGVGLATPYLLVMIAPKAVALLPKPGPWLMTLRRIFVVLLLATMMWLLWVLSSQIGVGLALLAALCVAGLMFLFKRAAKGEMETNANLLPSSLMIIALVIAIAAYGQKHDTGAGATVAEQTVWQPFNQAAIPALLQEGKVVFVDVTADWCLTCKVNKLAVMDRQEIRDLLAQPNHVAMRADWTNYDESIAKYLAAYRRAGIPFNIVYGAGAPEGIVLNELLSIDAVKDALQEAAGK